jgi:WD40 repeat protein
MSARSAHRRDVPDPDLPSGIRIKQRSRRFRTSLPSPFFLAIAVVFVILPLIWPAIDDQATESPVRAVFNLKTDVSSLSLSPDAHCLVATCRDRPIWVWRRDAQQNWSEIRLPEHRPGGTRSLALRSDGKTLAAGNMDGTVSLWNIESGQSLANLAAGTDMILGVAFSPDGTILASASASSEIRLWDVASRSVRTVLGGHCGPVTTIGFTPDGHTLVSGGEDGTIRLWNAQNPKEPSVLRGHHDVVLAAAVSPNGAYLATTSLGGHGIQIWKLHTQELHAILHTEALTLTCLAFGQDEKTLFAGDEHGTVSLWDLREAKLNAAFPAHVGWIKGLAISDAGKTLVSGGNDGLVRVWDLAALCGTR